MAEKEPQQQKILLAGQHLYDAVRPLFDVSNKTGLPVSYIGYDRPHLATRVINAQFKPYQDDVVENGAFRTGFYLDRPTRVHMSIFSADPTWTLSPESIRVFLGNSRRVGLQPNGDIDPYFSDLSEAERQGEVARTHSTFGLVARLIETGRLYPDDGIVVYPEEVPPTNQGENEIIILGDVEPIESPQDIIVPPDEESGGVYLPERDDEITVYPEEIAPVVSGGDEIVILGEEPVREVDQNLIVILDEILGLVPEEPEIVIRNRDLARNPIEWIKGVIGDVRDSIRKNSK